MADGTHIAWTEATWNPITGCSVVSPGCTNCYAMQLAGTRLQHHPSRSGLTKLTKAGPVWTGEVRFNEQWLDQPLRWSRPRRVFVCAHGDLFHESVPDEWIDQVFAVMALAPRHAFQALTKRPERMRKYVSDIATQGRIARALIDRHLLTGISTFAAGPDWPVCSIGDIDDPDDVALKAWPLPNVWLGTSVEDQARADERIPILLDTPAAVRWISAEPLLGPVDLHAFLSGLSWVVVGGESGRNARPFNIGWGKRLIMQCKAEGVAVFMKQFGSNPVTHEFGPWTSGTGKGTDPSEWPAAMRVQEYPAS